MKTERSGYSIGFFSCAVIAVVFHLVASYTSQPNMNVIAYGFWIISFLCLVAWIATGVVRSETAEIYSMLDTQRKKILVLEQELEELKRKSK